MHWALPETASLTDSEPSPPAVHSSLGHGDPPPHHHHHQLNIVPKAFLLQAEAQVCISYLQVEVGASVHSALPDSMVPEDVRSSFYPLATQRFPWDQLREHQWKLLHFGFDDHVSLLVTRQLHILEKHLSYALRVSAGSGCPYIRVRSDGKPEMKVQ